ncbi:MAG TPA: manganese efflux pump MntP family protein [Ignavibacteriaceae bacterium]|nr:manganese efflux pump MntP family protein [Ignavibacteriaceae bacterium]
MSTYSIVLVAFGLSMDAFAVSITNGMNSKSYILKQAFKIGLLFGLFQAIMPLIGYIAGVEIKEYIANIDHWIAFTLLMFLGLKMITDAIKNETEPETKLKFSNNIYVILLLAVATSIDALVVGLSLSIIGVAVLIPAIITGIITFAMSFIGVSIGGKFGKICGNKFEIIGGLVLCFIGIKVLIEHLVK